jgi:hypothetical protein
MRPSTKPNASAIPEVIRNNMVWSSVKRKGYGANRY